MRRQLLSAAAVIAAAGLMNVARIDRTNMPVDPAQTVEARTRMPEDVAAIFQRACLDCHSERTEWPWHSKVAPFQWLVAADVYGGRAHLNFSTWGRYTPDERTERMIGICEMVGSDRMPPRHYKLGHYPAAWLSDDDKKAVCDWVKTEVQLAAIGSSEADLPPASFASRRLTDDKGRR
jgi:hypothetical protein